jgi:hypothetical protein
LGFWGGSTELDSRLPWSLAEGEELGSNLLRVAKSGLWVRAVPLEVHDPGQNGRRLKESQTAVPGDHPAVHGIGTLAKPISSPLIDRIGWSGLGLGGDIRMIGLPWRADPADPP